MPPGICRHTTTRRAQSDARRASFAAWASQAKTGHRGKTRTRTRSMSWDLSLISQPFRRAIFSTLPHCMLRSALFIQSQRSSSVAHLGIPCVVAGDCLGLDFPRLFLLPSCMSTSARGPLAANLPTSKFASGLFCLDSFLDCCCNLDLHVHIELLEHAQCVLEDLRDLHSR